MQTLLLHNPTAGASHPNKQDLMRLLKAAGLAPSYQSAKDEAYKDVLKRKWDLVIVAGGDGTVARAVCALRNRKVPVAILPIGTANNIARAVGLEGNAEAIIPLLSSARSRRLDIGRAKGPWGKRCFLEAVGFGAIAKAISHQWAQAAEAAAHRQGPGTPASDAGRSRARTFRHRSRRRGVCR